MQKEWCYIDVSRSKIQKLLVWILVGSGLTKSNFTFSKRFSVSGLSDNFLILSRILFLAPLVTPWKVKGIIMKSFPSSTNEKNHKAVLFTIYTSVWALWPITNLAVRAIFNWMSKIIWDCLFFCLSLLCDWCIKLTPLSLSQPIRPKTKTNDHLVTCVFLWFRQFGWFYYEFSSALDPLTPKISLVILLTVCEMILIISVWRIWHWINW